MNLFPEIKTHRHNIPMYQLPPNNKREIKYFLNKSLFMLGKKKELELCKATLNKVYKNEETARILIRGVFGTGKSLFCRKLLYEFFDQNKELRMKLMYLFVKLDLIHMIYRLYLFLIKCRRLPSTLSMDGKTFLEKYTMC